MDSKCYSFLTANLGKDIVGIIDKYCSPPGVFDLISVDERDDGIHDFLDQLLAINPKLKLIASHIIDKVIYHGRECEYYVCNIYKIDRFIIWLRFEGLGNDITCCSIGENDSIDYQVYTENNFSWKILKGNECLGKFFLILIVVVLFIK